MTPEQFDALEKWVRAEAKVAMARRTYQNDRAIAEVEAKADEAKRQARAVLVRS